MLKFVATLPRSTDKQMMSRSMTNLYDNSLATNKNVSVVFPTQSNEAEFATKKLSVANVRPIQKSNLSQNTEKPIYSIKNRMDSAPQQNAERKIVPNTKGILKKSTATDNNQQIGQCQTEMHLQTNGEGLMMSRSNYMANLALLTAELDASKDLNQKLANQLARTEKELQTLKIKETLQKENIEAAVANKLAEALVQIQKQAPLPVPNSVETHSNQSSDLSPTSSQEEHYHTTKVNVKTDNSADKMPSYHDLQRAIEEMCNEREIWMEKNQSLSAQLASAEDEIKNLKKTLADSITNADELLQSREEYEKLKYDFDRQRDAWQYDKLQYHNILSENNILNAKYTELKNQLESETNEKANITQDLNTVQLKMKELEEIQGTIPTDPQLVQFENSENIDKINEELNRLKEENKKLENKVTEMKNDFDGLTKRYRDCTEQLADSQEKLVQTKEKLHSTEHTLKLMYEESKEKEINERRKLELQKLHQKIEESEFERNRVKEYYDVLKKENRQMENELNDFKENVVKLTNDVKVLQEERDGLKKAILNLQKELDENEVQKENFQSEKKVLRAENRGLQAQVESLSAMLEEEESKIQNELEEMKMEKERLESELEERIKSVKNIANDHQIEMNQLQSRFTDKENEITELEDTIKSLRNKLLSQIEKSDKENEESGDESKQVEKLLAKIEEQKRLITVLRRKLATT